MTIGTPLDATPVAREVRRRDTAAGASYDDAALTAWLEERLRRRPVAYREARLRDLDVGTHAVDTIADVRGAHMVRESDVSPDAGRDIGLHIRH